ncbi:MAG TPA: hypothetical protein ENG99_01005 [bacterium]|nr:hypothetical protein [bacterium]
MKMSLLILDMITFEWLTDFIFVILLFVFGTVFLLIAGEKRKRKILWVVTTFMGLFLIAASMAIIVVGVKNSYSRLSTGREYVIRAVIPGLVTTIVVAERANKVLAMKMDKKLLPLGLKVGDVVIRTNLGMKRLSLKKGRRFPKRIPLWNPRKQRKFNF